MSFELPQSLIHRLDPTQIQFMDFVREHAYKKGNEGSEAVLHIDIGKYAIGDSGLEFPADSVTLISSRPRDLSRPRIDAIHFNHRGTRTMSFAHRISELILRDRAFTVVVGGGIETDHPNDSPYMAHMIDKTGLLISTGVMTRVT